MDGPDVRTRRHPHLACAPLTSACGCVAPEWPALCGMPPVSSRRRAGWFTVLVDDAASFVDRLKDLGLGEVTVVYG
ncbi:hypothetical protein ACFQ51_51625 [Streptomyces kaempferi]